MTAARKWITTVGLEVHVQIATLSKLFSGASAKYGGVPNNNVAYLDAALPGTLPVLNRGAVEAAVLASAALSCRTRPRSTFERKHYFYSDLPTGYQITQHRDPIAVDGFIDFMVYTPGYHKKPYRKISRIQQIQLEQDSGKSLHDYEFERSLVDLNRAGVPLIEIVFDPDLQDGEEAIALVKELSLILSRLKICSGKMEEGALRVDANISVSLEGEALGTRTEVKNIGSFRGVANAIKYEAQRQISLIESGESVVNETRAWDALAKATVPMRDKEVKQDYRYMPEPNLPPLVLNMTDLNDSKHVCVKPIISSLPELPEETRKKLINAHQLSTEYAIQLVNEDVLLNYFYKIIENPNRSPKKVADLLMMELRTSLNKFNISLNDCLIKSDVLAEVHDLLESKTINLKTVRNILDIIIGGDTSSPTEIIKKNNWYLLSDDSLIQSICENVITENPKHVNRYKNGKTKALYTLLGIIAKNNDSNLDMKKVSEKLEELLKEIK